MKTCRFLIFRGLFIIDDKGVLRQITMNDLPVSVFNGTVSPPERCDFMSLQQYNNNVL